MKEEIIQEPQTPEVAPKKKIHKLFVATIVLLAISAFFLVFTVILSRDAWKIMHDKNSDIGNALAIIVIIPFTLIGCFGNFVMGGIELAFSIICMKKEKSKGHITILVLSCVVLVIALVCTFLIFVVR